MKKIAYTALCLLLMGSSAFAQKGGKPGIRNRTSNGYESESFENATSEIRFTAFSNKLAGIAANIEDVRDSYVLSKIPELTETYTSIGFLINGGEVKSSLGYSGKLARMRDHLRRIHEAVSVKAQNLKYTNSEYFCAFDLVSGQLEKSINNALTEFNPLVELRN